MKAHIDLLPFFAEYRINRYARHIYGFFWDAQSRHIHLCFFGCDEIPVYILVKPQCVRIDIGHNYPDRNVYHLFLPKINEDFGGQEMGADSDFGFILEKESYESPRTQHIEGQTPFLVFPGAVHRVVCPPEYPGTLINKLFVEIRIHFSEYAVRILENLDVMSPDTLRFEGGKESIGSAHVACSGRYGKNHYLICNHSRLPFQDFLPNPL